MPPTQLQIKQYNRNHLRDVLLLHKTAMEKVGAYKGDGPWEDDLRDIETHYLKSGGEFLLLFDNTILIGMGAFRRITLHEAEIKRMRIAPEYQGKGYGKYLLTNLEECATKMGYSSLILETSDKQISANALYKNYGFKAFKHEIIDGYNCTWYRKKYKG